MRVSRREEAKRRGDCSTPTQQPAHLLGCHRKRPAYDRLPPRWFALMPLWQIGAFFVCAMRSVDCPRCGIVVEEVPWSDGKSPLTTTYRRFLARWAKRLSWQEVAAVFHTTWEAVSRVRTCAPR